MKRIEGTSYSQLHNYSSFTSRNSSSAKSRLYSRWASSILLLRFVTCKTNFSFSTDTRKFLNLTNFNHIHQRYQLQGYKTSTISFTNNCFFLFLCFLMHNPRIPVLNNSSNTNQPTV